MVKSAKPKAKPAVGSSEWTAHIIALSMYESPEIKKVRVEMAESKAAALEACKEDPGLRFGIQRFFELQEKSGCESDSMN